MVLFNTWNDSSVGKESACNAGDPSSSPGLGRPPEEGKGYPLQYSGLENSMDCIVSPWGHKESDTTEPLSLHFHIHVDFPDSPVVKNSSANAGNRGLIPGLRDSINCGATKPAHCSY